MGDRELAGAVPDVPRWKMASASVVGTAHLRTGQPCQDSTQFRCLPITGAPADTLIAAVADGAGSAPYSDQGSRLAAASSINAIAGSLAGRPGSVDPEALQQILAASIDAAHHAVNDLAEANEHRPREYATTLLVAVHVNGVLGAAQIGDGAVVAAGADSEYVLITHPDQGEYANETSFVTESRYLDTLQVSVIPGLRARYIAMFSDGIQNLVLDYRDPAEPVPHTPFFRGVFSWLEQQPDELSAYVGLRRFLKSPRVNARTNDDLSLLLARRAEA